MSKRAVAVIAAGFLTVFTAFGVRYSYGILLPEMLSSLGISKTEAGVIFSAFIITYTVFSPILGLLADRYDVRLILTLFSALLGAGTLLMSRATTVFNASFFFMLVGLGHSACWVPVVALVQRWVPDNRRGVSLAFTDLGSASSIAVCSAAMPIIVANFSWRGGWTILGLFAFLVAAVNFFLVRSRPTEKGKGDAKSPFPVSGEPIKRTYQRLFRDYRFWLVGLSYFSLGFAIIIPFTFLSTYIADGLEIAYVKAARMVAVIAVAGIIGKLFLGHLSDSMGRVKIMMICGLLVASGSLGIAWSERLLTIGLFTAVFGLGYGAIWPVYAAAAQDFFQKQAAGSVMGLWTLILGCGTTLGPILSGWTIDRSGAFTAAFLLAFAAGTISLILLFPMLGAEVRTPLRS